VQSSKILFFIFHAIVM